MVLDVARQFLSQEDVLIVPKAYSNYVINIGSLELQDVLNRMNDNCRMESYLFSS